MYVGECLTTASSLTTFRFSKDTSMKKKTLKRVLILILIVLTIAAITVGSIIYVRDYRKTKVFTSVNGSSTMTVYMVGEPDFPYGSTSCRLVLKTKGKDTVKEDFSVKNDGAPVTEDNFTVEWKDNSVRLRVTGSEQEINSYVYGL